MGQEKICLASDNWAPVHPSILETVALANNGYAAAYGGDAWTAKAQEIIKAAFKAECKVLFVPNGTGGNVLALKLACLTYESVICTDIAHIQYQEAGAVEAVIGCKLLTVPHSNGKITPESILKKIKKEKAFGRHSTLPRVVSITTPTEIGTVYSLDELRAISNLCKEQGLLFHIDGSRLYNAVIFLECSLSDITDAGKPDLLSLGGTKNGLMGAEALLIFNPELESGCEFLQKQTLQLLSKMRYLSAQFIPFFEQDLWRTLAAQANQKAKEIGEVIKNVPWLSLSYPVESNQVFFLAPQDRIPLIQEKVFCYPWDTEKGEVRFIASWNTSDAEIKNLKETLTSIGNSRIK